MYKWRFYWWRTYVIDVIDVFSEVAVLDVLFYFTAAGVKWRLAAVTQLPIYFTIVQIIIFISVGITESFWILRWGGVGVQLSLLSLLYAYEETI